MRKGRFPLAAAALAVVVGLVALAVVALPDNAGSARAAGGPAQIAAIGAENQYANVIRQIGGRYVAVTAIERNPNTDPHSFEASPSIAAAVSSARLIVQNGLGYDDYMDKIEAASSGSGRDVIDVQKLLGLPDSSRNPHLWYRPRTMPAVAAALAGDLARLQPAHAAYFHANARRFDASLQPWYRAIGTLKRTHPQAPVATTEPVGDYMLAAAGSSIKTPWTLQADIMNGVDPAPQEITLQHDLLAHRRVQAFLYNRQVTDTLTQEFLATARTAGVPVVGLYETMPTGYSYQSWMLAETRALMRALQTGASTTTLG